MPPGGGSYPSVGIHVDLNEIAQAQAAYSALKGQMKDVGQAAQQAGEQSTRAIANQKQAADQLFAFTRRMTAQRIDQTIAADRDEQRSADQTFAFRRRMNAQRQADDARTIAQGIAAQRAADQEAQRSAQSTFAFRRRMTEQRIADAQREAQAEIAAQQRAVNEFRGMMDQRISAGREAGRALEQQAQATFDFQRRMTAQRIEEETRAAAIVTAAWERYYAQQRAPGGTTRPELNGIRSQMVSGGGFGFIPPSAVQEVSALSRELQRLVGIGGGVLNFIHEARTAFAGMASGIIDVVIVATALGSAIVPIANMADQMSALEARTALYAARASDVPYTFEQIYRTAQATRTPLEAVATLYTRLAPLAAQLGRSQTQILRTVQTVSESFQIGGATPEESRSSSQQLAQALASNRLGGDELRSLAENAPVLVSRIAAALNMNTGQFINWAHQGHASTQVIVDAIDHAQTEIDRMFRTLPVTIGQSITVVTNSFTHLVGEANKATGASVAVASAILGFSRFLDSASTLHTLEAAIRGVGTAFNILGTAVSTVIAYAPAITALIAAMVGARILPAIFLAMRTEMIAFAAASAIAGTATTVLNVGLAAAGAGAAGLFGGIGRLVTMLGGPLGIALIAAAGAYSAFTDAENRAKAVADDFRTAQQGGISAIQNAMSFADRYNVSTTNLTTTMNTLTGATQHNTTANSDAMNMAYARAEAERALTVELLRQAAVQEGRVAQQAEDSQNGIVNQISRRFEESMASEEGPLQAGHQRDLAARNARDTRNLFLGIQARQRESALNALADQMASARLTVTAPGPGGTPAVTPPAAGHGPTSGGENAIARLRAEVAGLNNQISALNVDPLSDLTARIQAAGAAAAAARENGRNAPLADQARSLAMLKEEATIRLQLTQTLVQQERAQLQATQAAEVGAEATYRANQIMSAFYDSGQQGAEGYAAALEAQHQATLDGQFAQAQLTIAQQFGVTTIGQIADAYQRATGASREQSIALQNQAEKTYEQQQAAIRAADAQNRLADANGRIGEVKAQNDQTERYITALQGGTAALAAFNREQAIRNELAAHPGEGLANATSIVDSIAVGAERQRSAEMDRQANLASLTTRQREQEERVTAIIQSEMVSLGASAKDLSAADRDRLDTQARITAELQAQTAENTALKVSVQDSIRQAFIESGRLDFSSLRNGVGQALRRAIYDNFIARPINIVVNAVVDFATQGLEQAIRNVLGGTGGTGGNIFSGLTQMLGGGAGATGLFSAGGPLSGIMQSLGSVGSTIGSIGTTLSSLLPYAGQLATIYAVGSSIGGGLAHLLGGNEQVGKSVGGLLGGIPGAIASLFAGPNDPSATTSIRLANGRFSAQGVRVDDGGPGDEITQLSATITQALQGAAVSFGVDLSKLGNFYTSVGYTATDRKGYTKGYFGGLVTGADYGSSSEQIRAALYANGGAQFAGVTDPQVLAQDLVKAMLTQAAKSGALDLSDAEVALINAADNLDDAANTIKNARAVASGVSSSLLAFTNPRQAALNDLYTQQISRRQQILGFASQGLISPAKLAQISSDISSLEKYEISDVISRFATTVGGATHSLQDFITAQKAIKTFVAGLAVSALSPLSPEAQLRAAGSSFFSTINSARAGNYDAVSSLPDVAQTYLQQAQGFYGSTEAYNSIFNTVTDALNGVADQTAISPDADAVVQALAELQTAVTSAGADIVAAVTGGANDNGALTDAQVQQIVDALAGNAEAGAAASQLNADQIAAALASAGFMGGALAGGNLTGYA